MEQAKLYECRGCDGRNLTRQACEAVIRDAAELQLVRKFTDGDAVAKLPEGFCGDKHKRGIPQEQPGAEEATVKTNPQEALRAIIKRITPEAYEFDAATEQPLAGGFIE